MSTININANSKLPISLKKGTDNYSAWHGPFEDVFNPATVMVGRDLLIAVKKKLVAGTLNENVIEVTGAGTAGSLIRLGIYKDNGNLFPGEKLVDSGTVTGDSNAVKTALISTVVPSTGIYWLVFWHNSVSNITVRAVPAITGASEADMGINKNAFTSGAYNRIAASLTFSTLPNNFPTTGLTISNATIPCPLVSYSS